MAAFVDFREASFYVVRNSEETVRFNSFNFNVRGFMDEVEQIKRYSEVLRKKLE